MPLNRFGEDWKKNNYEWSTQLCEADSDGDGLSNGEELGDPCCLWAAWGIPSDYTADFTPTHPGDANDKPQGYQKPACGTTAPKATAPVMGKFNPGEVQKSVDMFIDNYRIPMPGNVAPRTTYVDIAWNFPDDSEDLFHAIYADAIVNSPGILHHFVITGCPEKWPAEAHGKPVTDLAMKRSCQKPFGGWAPGAKVVEMPGWAGQPIGKTAGIKAFMVQVHFDNPHEKKGLVSRDGVRIYYTPTLRNETLTGFETMLLSNNPSMLLPPQRQRYFMTRECIVDIKEPTSQKDVEARLIGASFHAHLLGKEMIAERIRGDDRLTLAHDDPWFFDDQYWSNTYVRNITFKTGDKIQSTCIFDTSSRSELTVIGAETTDEMCWSTFTLRPGGLKASCTGKIWTGSLSGTESLLGLQSRHPVATADGVWSGSSVISGGSVISAKYVTGSEVKCIDSPMAQPFCADQLVGRMNATFGAAGCDKTLDTMGVKNDIFKASTPLQICCTEACKSLCPAHAKCSNGETPPTEQSTTTTLAASQSRRMHARPSALFAAGVAFAFAL